MLRPSICATFLLQVLSARVRSDAQDLTLNELETPSRVDVVIIGAGYAGLSAARDLQAAGLDVVVFEALDRAGGRTRNHNVPGVERDRGGNLEVVEVGGQWLGTRDIHPSAHQLIVDELGFELSATLQGSSNLAGGATVASTSKGTSLDLLDGLGWGNAAELAWGILEATREKWLLKLPWMGWLRDRLGAMTFAEWLEQKGVDGDGLEMIKTAIMGCGNHPSNVNALGPVYGLGGDGMAKNAETATYRVKGGLGAPVLAMAEELGSMVQYNSAVVSISQDEDIAHVRSLSTDGAAVEVSAQHVLFSGSPYTTLNITFTPPLPQEKREVLEQLQNGQTVKAHLVYDRPFWRDSNLSGQIFNIVNLEDNFTACIDNTFPDSNLGIMLCLAQDNFGLKFAKLSEEERRDRMAGFLATHYGDDAALQPLWYTDYDWESQPSYRGGCAGFWPPHKGMNEEVFGRVLNEDFGRVSWIGSDLESDNNHLFRRGFVESAILTGRATARRLIAELVPAE